VDEVDSIDRVVQDAVCEELKVEAFWQCDEVPVLLVADDVGLPGIHHAVIVGGAGDVFDDFDCYVCARGLVVVVGDGDSDGFRSGLDGVDERVEVVEVEACSSAVRGEGAGRAGGGGCPVGTGDFVGCSCPGSGNLAQV